MKKVVWVTRSFLDYRIPVFKELQNRLGDNFYLMYSADYVPERVQNKIQDALGKYAIPLSGEISFGGEDNDGMANEGFNFRMNPKVFLRLIKISPDIIICDGFFKWTFFSLVYRLLFRKKLVVCYERTAHTERKAQGVRVWYRKMALRLTDSMSCNGVLSKEYVVSLGYSDKRITVGHMVADTSGIESAVSKCSVEDIVKFKEKFDLPDVIYLYVGSLSKRKGIEPLLNVWESLFANNHDVALVLVGTGEYKEYTKKFSINAKSRILPLGRVDYDQLGVIYRSASIFIIGTLEDNWSLVVPEAMSASLPIISSIYNGCWPELVTQSNGWSFDPFDEAGYERCLSDSYENRKLFGSMGRVSRDLLRKHNASTASDAILSACDIAVGKSVEHAE